MGQLFKELQLICYQIPHRFKIVAQLIPKVYVKITVNR